MDLFEPWRNAPPPRHTMESDSEEEQDPEDLQQPSASTSTSFRRPLPSVNLEWIAEEHAPKVGTLIIAIEEAGMTWSSGLDFSKLTVDAYLRVNDNTAASISYLPGPTSAAVAFVAGPLCYEAMHAAAQTLLSELAPSSITIIESYSYLSYISSGPTSASLRYLSSERDSSLSLDAYEPPNLVQGLPAAWLCEADEHEVPCVIVLFPSNLSDRTRASAADNATHRQPVPESVYDYGGPSPNSESLLNSANNRRALIQLGEQLKWDDLGWSIAPSSSNDSSISKISKGPKEVGFGWWEKAKQAQRQTVRDGGMYT